MEDEGAKAGGETEFDLSLFGVTLPDRKKSGDGEGEDWLERKLSSLKLLTDNLSSLISGLVSCVVQS